MYRVASIAVYDVMGDVFITSSVRTYEHTGEERHSTEFTTATTVPSTGEDDGRQWLKDALVGLIEDL